MRLVAQLLTGIVGSIGLINQNFEGAVNCALLFALTKRDYSRSDMHPEIPDSNCLIFMTCLRGSGIPAPYASGQKYLNRSKVDHEVKRYCHVVCIRLCRIAKAGSSRLEYILRALELRL